MKRVYHPPPWGRKSWQAFAQGLALAVLLFILLPLAQFFASSVDEEPVSIRQVDTAPPPPPPPPPPPEPEEPEQVSVSVDPAPPPEEPEPPPLSLREMRLALDLDPAGAIAGDFAVDFEVAGGGMGDVEAFEISDVDRPPRPLSARPPRYPPDLRRAGISGSVTLVFIVEADGTVSNLEVETSDHRALERPAVEAVRTWRFTPGERDGTAIRTIVRQTVEFTVE